MNKAIVSFLPIALLAGCATTGKIVDTGTVTGMQQVANKDYAPGRGTGVGAGVGAGTGAAGGALYGATGCAAATVLTWGWGASICPALIASYAVVGAGVGAAAGGVGGYVSDMHKQGNGVYLFTVRPDHKGHPLYIYQNLQQPIRPGDRVNIYLDGKTLFLKKSG